MILNPKKTGQPRTRSFAAKKVLSLTLLSLLMAISFTSVSYADWSFGIGTGLFGLNVDGEIGFHTNLAGSTKLDIDLDAEDTSDLMESAFGLGGYATDGTWMIKYSIGELELEGKKSTSLPAINSTANTKVNFEVTAAEVTVGYPVYQTPSVIVTVDGDCSTNKKIGPALIDVLGSTSIYTTRKD